MKIDELIKVYGSQRKISKHFGFSQQRVNNWATRGSIPEDAQYKIAYISGGKFEVDEVYDGK